MKAANDLVDIIKDIIQQELNTRDQVILCEIASVSEDNSHCDVYVVPDQTTEIHNIPNMTQFILYPGEYCYVYKIQNSFTNCFVCYVKGANTTNYVEKSQTVADLSLYGNISTSALQKALGVDNLQDIIMNYLIALPGYDASKQQLLTNNAGVLQWTTTTTN